MNSKLKIIQEVFYFFPAYNHCYYHLQVDITHRFDLYFFIFIGFKFIYIKGIFKIYNQNILIYQDFD